MSLRDDTFRREVLLRLEEAILADVGAQRERVVFLAADGRPLLVIDGTPDEVSIDAETVTMWHDRVDLVTHNHPRGMSFTVDDVTAAITLNAREVNAFTARDRFRLLRRPDGRWPELAAAQHAVHEIEAALAPLVAPVLAPGGLRRDTAEAIYRRMRWAHFARRFHGEVDYVEEQR